LIIPIVLPLIKIPVTFLTGQYSVPSLLDEVVIFPDQVTVSNPVPYSDYFKLVYSGIIVLLSFRMLAGIYMIIRLYYKGNKFDNDGLRLVVSHKDINPFSIFGIVFVNKTHTDKEGLSQIIAHEKVHIRQFHSFDVLIAELVCAVYWINPFFWKIRESLKSTHEYLADEQVREQGFDLAGYFMLLFNNVVGMRIGLANNFNQSLTLKRMKMMKRNRSPRYVRWLYLLVLPFVAVIVLVISCQNAEGKFQFNDRKNVTSEPADKITNDVIDQKEETCQTVDEVPVFGEGQDALVNYLIAEIKYPKDAKEKGIQGKVMIGFTVSKTGKVTNVEVMQSVNPLLDAEAVRVISVMPDWKPGKKNGEPVDVKMNMPINFKLQDKK
jgi:TonB family protein